MLTINLVDLAAYDFKGIYIHLMQKNETRFHIIMPRLFIAPQDPSFEIENEYDDALYFGQVLSAFSHDFCYNVPSEYSSIPFAWEFSTTDLEKLADTLYYLAKGIADDPESGDMLILDKYWDDKDLFWEQCFNDEIEPVCQGLLYILEKMEQA